MTPRGGFMARPGLKPPPRHAVVVRGGDAPISSDIPVARSSFPPPPLAETAPISASEKITQRAIPTPPSPRIASVVFDEPRRAPRSEPPAPVAFESAPPPSDAPTYASIPPASFAPRPRRKSSGWAIAAAAAAGLILGLTSVLATRGAAGTPEQPLAAAALSEPLAPVATTTHETKPPSAASPSPSALPSAAQKPGTPAPAAPAKPTAASAKQTIF